MNFITGAVAIAVLVFAAPASGQWVKYRDSSIPWTPDDKPNLTAAAPRAQDGKPDLSGVWLPPPDPNGKPGQSVESIFDFVPPRYFVDITADLKPEDVQFQPWAETLFRQRLQSQGKIDPVALCKPSGVPALGTIPLPYKIVQTPKLILILYEENTVFRQVFLESRRPVEDAQPRWMGYSTGRWDGDTLVVDTVGFNDQGWLDRMGHPHSDALHLIERFRRPDAGHLEVQVTVDDPKAYRKPITYTQRAVLVPDEDLLEYFCSENEKDVQHFQ